MNASAVTADGGEGGTPAFVVWTKAQYLALLDLLQNNNGPYDFLMCYRAEDGQPRFSRSKRKTIEQYGPWAWKSITPNAREEKVAVGFYPSNAQGMSRWAAIDFDAHDGDGERARRLAFALLERLQQREPDLHIILCSSGSAGWHLFVFATAFRPVTEWAALLKQAAWDSGAELRDGVCEVFPKDVGKNGSLGHAIRAPGSWNPKTGAIGLIVFESVSALLMRKEREEEDSTTYYRSTQAAGSTDARPHLSEDVWQCLRACRIDAAGTRHAKLKELLSRLYRRLGRGRLRCLAEQLYVGALIQPTATLDEHLKEAERMTDRLIADWKEELTLVERAHYDRLTADSDKDLFRIVRNFAASATIRGNTDFPIAITNVAARLAVTAQRVSVMRSKFEHVGIIRATVPAHPNRTAARYVWLC